MTYIDIERLLETARSIQHVQSHWEDCIYDHQSCAVLALIERLEQVQKESGLRYQRMAYESEQHAKAKVALADAEAQRDRLIDAANVMVNVFVPRSDSSPDAHVEQEAWKKLDHVIDAVFAENKMLKENR